MKTAEEYEEQIEGLKEYTDELESDKFDLESDIESLEEDLQASCDDLHIILSALDMTDHEFNNLRSKLELDGRNAIKRWVAEKGE